MDLTHKDFGGADIRDTEGKVDKDKLMNFVKELSKRSPEEQLKSKLDYCREAIRNKKFKLVKWFPAHETWSHDHCEVCGKHISDNEDSENEAYTNSTDEGSGDWICKECFNKYGGEIGLEADL